MEFQTLGWRILSKLSGNMPLGIQSEKWYIVLLVFQTVVLYDQKPLTHIKLLTHGIGSE